MLFTRRVLLWKWSFSMDSIRCEIVFYCDPRWTWTVFADGISRVRLVMYRAPLASCDVISTRICEEASTETCIRVLENQNSYCPQSRLSLLTSFIGNIVSPQIYLGLYCSGRKHKANCGSFISCQCCPVLIIIILLYGIWKIMFDQFLFMHYEISEIGARHCITGRVYSVWSISIYTLPSMFSSGAQISDF